MAKRIFFAIPLPDKVKRQLAAFQSLNDRPFNETLRPRKFRWMPYANWHITQLFIGEMETTQIQVIVEQVFSLFAQTRPFRLPFHRFYLVPKPRYPRMIWAKYQEQETFAALHRALQSLASTTPENRKPLPHITLARFQPFRLHESFTFRQPDGSLDFKVKQVELWESVFTKGKVAYVPLEVFPLANAGNEKV